MKYLPSFDTLHNLWGSLIVFVLRFYHIDDDLLCHAFDLHITECQSEYNQWLEFFFFF